MMVSPIVNPWGKRLFTLRAACDQHPLVEVRSDAISSKTYEMWNDAVVRTDLTGMLSPKYYPPPLYAAGVYRAPYWELNGTHGACGGHEPNLLHFWENPIVKPYNKVTDYDLNGALPCGNRPGPVALLLQQNHDLRVALSQKDMALEDANRDRRAERHGYEQIVVELQQEIKSLKGRLQRYENRNRSGRTEFNKIKKKVDEEESARRGKPVIKNHKIGPPEGHAGQQKPIKISDVVRHDLTRCLYCNSYNLMLHEYMSKCVIDFSGNTRDILWVRHEGHSMKCPKGHIMVPHFPGIPGTSLGPELLRHVLVYETRRAVDADVSYYFRLLHKAEISNNAIWNARKAISRVLAPSIQYIIEELKKAKFLQLDETVYRYHNKKIYVWIIRCDTASLILPLTGRGAKDIYPFVKDLLDKPIVVDGYVVYPSLFKIIQRCWSHILRDAVEVCKTYKGISHYVDLYCKLKAIFRTAKRIAKKTAKSGGASMDICNALADEVRAVAAEYGSVGFAGTLENAADNLFTFLRYPGMPPTNNNSELDVRDWVVPQRNIRRKFMSQSGMTVFAMLQSYASTCAKLDLDLGDCFMKMLDDPLFNIFEEHERVHSGGLSKNTTTPALPAPPVTPQLPIPITRIATNPVQPLSDPQTTPQLPIPITAPALPEPYTLVIATILMQARTSTKTLPRHIHYYSKLNSIVPYTQMIIHHRSSDHLLFHHKPPPIV